MATDWRLERRHGQRPHTATVVRGTVAHDRRGIVRAKTGTGRLAARRTAIKARAEAKPVRRCLPGSTGVGTLPKDPN